MNNALLVIPIADPHVGSIRGLHPNYVKRGGEWITIDEAGGWYYKNNPHYYLNSKQLRMWRHYENGILSLAKLRAQRRADIRLLIMGDAIDGDHHNTFQLTTKDEGAQTEAFIQMMLWTLEKLDFSPGRDKLAVLEGTESHTRDNEELIGQKLPAEKFPGGASCAEFLEVDLQGNLCWFYHHGVQANYSFLTGTTLYNYLRKIYVNERMSQKHPPNLIMTADKHKIDRQVYQHNGHELHGVILPPFQDKTRFTNKLPHAVVTHTQVGFSPAIIENGKIELLTPYLAEMPRGEVLTW